MHIQKLDRHDGKWTLRTNQGVVTAHTVVLGTNAYTDTLWPRLKQTCIMINYFQLATKPLRERVLKILPGGQGLWDTGAIMFSLRRNAYERLIIGSMGKVFGGNNGLSHRWAAQMLRQLFPDIGPVDFDAAWHGKIAMTPDRLPRIHRLAEGLYTPIGYNGRGITTGTVFGKAMAGLLAGSPEDELPLPISKPKVVAAAPLVSGLYDIAFKANQFWKSL